MSLMNYVPRFQLKGDWHIIQVFALMELRKVQMPQFFSVAL